MDVESDYESDLGALESGRSSTPAWLRDAADVAAALPSLGALPLPSPPSSEGVSKSSSDDSLLAILLHLPFRSMSRRMPFAPISRMCLRKHRQPPAGDSSALQCLLWLQKEVAKAEGGTDTAPASVQCQTVHRHTNVDPSARRSMQEWLISKEVVRAEMAENASGVNTPAASQCHAIAASVQCQAVHRRTDVDPSACRSMQEWLSKEVVRTEMAENASEVNTPAASQCHAIAKQNDQNLNGIAVEADDGVSYDAQAALPPSALCYLEQPCEDVRQQPDVDPVARRSMQQWLKTEASRAKMADYAAAATPRKLTMPSIPEVCLDTSLLKTACAAANAVDCGALANAQRSWLQREVLLAEMHEASWLKGRALGSLPAGWPPGHMLRDEIENQLVIGI